MLNLLRKQAAKYLLSQQNKPQKVADLKFAFVDSDGMRYYEWQTLSDIPQCRHLELSQMIGYSDARISPESLNVLCDEVDKRLHSIIAEKSEDKRRKSFAQSFALINEIRDRSSFSVPKDIMIRIAAIIICREDEDPEKFNLDIQNEKAAQFKKELNNGNAFFLKSLIMKELYNSYLGTTELLQRLLANWELEQRREVERLKILLQSDDYKSSETKTQAL